MRCPFCHHSKDKVVDSREVGPRDAVRRRRECLGCHRRFTTYEQIEEIPYLVIKKDGRHEAFDRVKLTSGLLRACEKRPVSAKALDGIIDEVERMLQDSTDREVETRLIGEKVMERLKELDQVSYVRFASVYRQFEDVEEFARAARDAREGEREGQG